MNILITGGSGDLGLLLAKDMLNAGDDPVRIDIRAPKNPDRGKFIPGSILDDDLLRHTMVGMDCVIHVAAWHGIHEVTGQADVHDFWDLNVSGTFKVFQAAAGADVRKFVYISSTSVLDRFGVYGHTKVLGEEIALTYHQRHGMDVIVLRPGAFIPYWNEAVYPSFAAWAEWYWKGAVHILDVAQAVQKSIKLMKRGRLDTLPTLFVDGKYEYTADDLEHWDANGPGSTFMKYYADYHDLALRYGLNPALRPTVFDIEPTRRWLGYEPTYSFQNLLRELKDYGEAGPPPPAF